MPRVVLTGRQLSEVAALSPELLKVLCYLVETWRVPQLVVTDIRRTDTENRAAKSKTRIHSVGPPWRAVDVRIYNLGEDYQRRAGAVANRVNRRWTYDPRRPKMNVAFARKHGTGPHLHLQVHPRTRQTELRSREVRRV